MDKQLHGGKITASCRRGTENVLSFADPADISLKKNSRMEKSARVGLGYIMGIDLPRLAAPLFEVRGLTLTYGENDDAVIFGAKKAGDKVSRYGGWEAEGAWKPNSPAQYTLAGHSLGHWLSAAASFYCAFKNESDIFLTAESLGGFDAAAAGAEKGGRVIQPRDIYGKIEYVINKLDELQSTEIPEGCTSVVHKEYIGGCDETPFLKCFNGDDDWLGGYWVPWYNIHKLFRGLLDVYDCAGRELALKAYKVLKKLADWAAGGTEKLTDMQMRKVLDTEYGGMNEVFARMYEITGEEKYKRAARRFTHDAVIDPVAAGNVSSLAGKHANTQIPKFIGAALLYECDGGKYREYAAACENFWNNVSLERCYAIGGNSLNEHFQPDGTEELGAKTCESCNTYNMMCLTEHLFLWKQKPVYMDWYERALYNHILGQQEPQTGAKMYFVSMEQGTHRIYEQKYNSWWCCTGTGMENPSRYTRTVYFTDNDDLYVNLYLPCRYTWKEKALVFDTETEYPYGESVKITVSGGSNTVNLRLRAPSWVRNSGRKMTATVNGERRAVSDGGEYIALRGIKAGDVIELVIPMAVSVYKSRDNKKIAYEYGPLVLAARLGGEVKEELEYIWEERNTLCRQTAYPSLKTSDGKGNETADDLASYPVMKDEKALLFTLPADKNTLGRDVTLVPFSDIPHGYHNIYFDTDAVTDGCDVRLSEIITDVVDPDGQQSELGHGMMQSTGAETEYRRSSVQGSDEHGQYRFAYGSGGFFKYDMLIDKSAAENYLMIRYFDTDSAVSVSDGGGQKTFNVRFKIFAADTEIAEVEIGDGEGVFADKAFEIPREIVAAVTETDRSTGHGIIEIKLAPCGDNAATVPYRRLYTLSAPPEI